MILFKACPKCRGDMKVDTDMYGEYRQCLQCGLILEGLAATPARQPAARKDAEPAARVA